MDLRTPTHPFVIIEDIGIMQTRDVPPKRIFFGIEVACGAKQLV